MFTGRVAKPRPHDQSASRPTTLGRRSSLREVTTKEQLLEQALGHVAAATQAMLELAENDVTGQLIFTTRQCLDVQTLLEDAGAVIEID